MLEAASTLSEDLMKTTHMIAAVVAAALTGCAPVLDGSGQSPATTLMIPLTGEAHGVGLGDPDGRGMAELHIDPARGRFCYILNVEGIAPARLAHIHKSPVGQAGGPIVVHLEAPTDGESEDCMAILPEVAQSLLRTPADYYVNVHNADYPSGAVRGQLG